MGHKITALTTDQKGLVTVEESTGAQEAYQTMRRHNVHHLIVTKQGTMSGIVSDRDLFEKAHRPGTLEVSTTVTVGEAMHRDVDALSETATLQQALDHMREHRVSALPIVSEGKPYGIVTHTDLLNLLQNLAAKDQEDSGSLKSAANRFASHPYGMRLIELLNDIGL